MIITGKTIFKPDFEAVICFCFDRKGDLIFLRKKGNHRFYRDLWGVLAGRIESEEKVIDAAAREIGEESGNDVLTGNLELVFEANFRHILNNGEDILNFKGHVFICKQRLGKIILDKNEHISHTTVKLALISGINKDVVIPDTLEIIDSLGGLAGYKI